MNIHSKNIKVTGGRLVVQNLNWFPDSRINEFTKSNFMEIIRRIHVIQTDNIKNEIEYGDFKYDSILSLSLLNIPWIMAIETRSKFLLNSGRIYWGGKEFKEGFVFEFDKEQNLILEEKENFEDTTVIGAEWRDVEYDYYHGSQDPTEVSEIVRNELGVKDFKIEEITEDSPEEVTDLGDVKVEILTFYAPELNENIEGRVLVSSSSYEDESKYSNLNEYTNNFMHWEKYDQFLVEIIDKSSIFGYILKEYEHLHDHKIDNVMAFTKEIFDYSVKDKIKNLSDAIRLMKDNEQILKNNLYIIGPGEWEEEIDLSGMDLDNLE